MSDNTKPTPLPTPLPLTGQATITLSANDIASIVAQAIRASKEPSADEQKKLDTEKLNKELQRAQWKAEAEDWQVQKELVQAQCDHKKPRGEDSMVGKLFSDGVYRIMCLRCQKFMAEVKATPEMLQAVMQADNAGVSNWENFARVTNGIVEVGQQA